MGTKDKIYGTIFGQAIGDALGLDTNAAVACAMLGAKFGYTSIPQKYTDGLTRKSDLMRITNYLMQIEI